MRACHGARGCSAAPLDAHSRRTRRSLASGVRPDVQGRREHDTSEPSAKYARIVSDEDDRLRELQAAVRAQVDGDGPKGASGHWRARRAAKMLSILLIGGGVVLLALIVASVYIAYNGWPPGF